MAAAYRAHGRTIGEGEPLFYATASVHVGFLRPTPSDSPILPRAHVAQMAERCITVSCSQYSCDVEYARGDVAAVRVPVTWGAAG